jgi:DNA invertase Pin-like site-specific DNA recombinase
VIAAAAARIEVALPRAREIERAEQRVLEGLRAGRGLDTLTNYHEHVRRLESSRASRHNSRSSREYLDRSAADRSCLYSASTRIPAKKLASASCPSSGSTCDTYWSGRTMTMHPVSRFTLRRSKMSSALGSGQNTFS